VHFPPLDAAEVKPALKVVMENRQIAKAPMNLFR